MIDRIRQSAVFRFFCGHFSAKHIICFFFLFTGTETILADADLTASRDATLTIAAGEKGLRPSRHFLYTIPDSAEMTFETLREADKRGAIPWQQLTNENLSYKKNPVWFKFVYKGSQAPAAPDWLLEIGDPLLDDLRVYVLKQGGNIPREYRLGDRRPFAERIMQHRFFLIPLPAPQATTLTVYFRVHTESLVRLPMVFAEQTEYFMGNHGETVFLGIFFGILIALLCYNSLLAFILRDSVFTFYVIYIAAMLMMQLNWEGLTFQYLYPNSPDLANRMIPAFNSFTVFWALVFSRKFLITEQTAPGLDLILKLLGILFFLSFCASFFLSYGFMIKIVNFEVLAGTVFLTVAGVQSWRSGFRPAPYYFTAWSFLIGGTITFIFRNLNILPEHLITRHAIKLGSVAEAILLSVAIAYRFRILKEEKSAADAAINAKNRFMSVISHEMRTPLNIVYGLGQILAKDHATDKNRKYLQNLMTANNTLMDLVNNILDFSRMEEGVIHPEPCPSSMRALVEEISAAMRILSTEKGLELRTICATPLPESAYFDPNRVRQVLLNLVTNAIKFTEKGSITLQVDWSENRKAGGGYFEIRVSDTGRGFPLYQVEQIFKPFVRGESRGSKIPGVGLGLAISRSLSEKMGGSLTVVSSDGKGSTFLFRLPADLATVPALIQTENAAAMEQSLPSGLKILVADDFPMNRDLIAAVMAPYAPLILEAENGIQAETIYKSALPDLSLIDISMPEQDGITTLKNIRKWEEQTKQRPGIFWAHTAHALADIREEIFDAGFDDIIIKPLNSAALIQKIRSILPGIPRLQS